MKPTMKPTDPNHIHTYDAQGNMTCCSLEEKIYQKADAKNLLHEEHSADDGHDHDHVDEGKGKLKIYLPVIVSLFMLLLGIAVDNLLKLTFFTGPIRLAWYLSLIHI